MVFSILGMFLFNSAIELHCRGSGQFGQLGLGSQNDESLPNLVKEIENEKCIHVTAGANSMFCFLSRVK